MPVSQEGFLTKYTKLFINRVILSAQGFPIVLSLAVLGVLLVLFRMKSVEQDYSINEIEKQTKAVSYLNKDLKAKKARHLSVKNLRKMATRYKLKRPKQSQIIVIP